MFVDKAPEVKWARNRPSVCYAGTCNHRAHDGIVNPRYIVPEFPVRYRINRWTVK